MPASRSAYGRPISVAHRHGTPPTIDLADAQARYEAQARVAERLYARASDPAWMKSVDRAEAIGVWEAAQIWAVLDQERFRESAENVTTAYRQAYGTDPATAAEELRGHQRSPSGVVYDSAEARSQPAGAGWPTEAVHARMVSDNLNAVDPVTTRSRRRDDVIARLNQGHSSRPAKQRTQGHER